MDARSVIAAVRDGRGLSSEAAEWFARGLAGEVQVDEHVVERSAPHAAGLVAHRAIEAVRAQQRHYG